MNFIDLPGESPGMPYSQAVGHDGLVFVAGQLAEDEPHWPGPAGDIAAETRMAMDRIGRILALAGASYGDILRVGVYMTDLDAFDAMNAVYRSYFPGPRLPARTTVGVARLLFGGAVEIDCVARIPSASRHSA
jgi:2-iminobutanoate/2-iminopropanoate deaminase